MPAIAKEEAVARLTRAAQQAPPDDLREIYNELFPGELASAAADGAALARLRSRVVDHIGRGLEAEEIVDLWNVVFPKERNVRYDEESETLHYSQGSEAARRAE